MTHATFSPTVLLVDDDPSVLDMLRRRFYTYTSLGVVVSDNLSDARKLLGNGRIHFDAVVADLAIIPDKQDPLNNLYDGVDFLGRVKNSYPDIPNYVLSVYADVTAYKEKSDDLGVDVRHWFQKLDFGGHDSEASPWQLIEHDLYAEILGQRIPISAEVEGGTFADLVRRNLKPMIRTYLQDLPSPYKVIEPIEVICRYEEETYDGENGVETVGHWLADALSLAMPSSGVGDDMGEALSELGYLLVDHYKSFIDADEGQIEGVLRKIYDGFKAHMSAA